MAVFHYRALDKSGKHKKGVLEADTARHVRQQLQEQGLMALELTSVTDDASSLTSKLNKPFSFTRAKRMSTQDLSLMTRQIATLLNAGIPLDEVLSGVAKQNTKANVRNIILGVRAKVMEGYTLAMGMGEFPAAFPKLYRTTVASGEKSGKLDQVLTRLAEYTEKQQHIKRKIRQALIYPSLMVVVSIFVVIFMLLYVVPKIIDVFNQTNQVLPLPTQILIAISGMMERDGLYLLGGVVMVGFGFHRLLKRLDFRRKFHRFLFKIPVIGKTIRTINSARFARTFGILNAATVPVLEAMQAAAQLITPLPMQEAVLKAIDEVREGVNIHTALQKTDYFSPMFIHLIGSGEASGQLDAMLEKAAANQEADVEALIEGSLTLFEPVMILVMGGIVMFIVMAVMLPIFALDNFNG
ncbi:MAG: type II secretion system protein GspF [Coxiella sp. RIFCSPHIGHO2_12_FULL_42_15]|nr:MAG: type II secretion system protein GspF [Coxiella sp. RIFCSPHIGHO2_12_FULL_42_15]